MKTCDVMKPVATLILSDVNCFLPEQGVANVTPQQQLPCLALQVMMAMKKITKITQKKIRLAQLVILK